MNKKMLFLVVLALVPSISFANKKDVCEEITSDLFGRQKKTNAEIAQRLRSIPSDDIYLTGINLEQLISATEFKMSQGGTQESNVRQECASALQAQLRGESRRRSGNGGRNRSNQNQSGGNTTGGDASGGDVGNAVVNAAISGVAAFDLDPRGAALRTEEPSDDEHEADSHAKGTEPSLTECKVLEETIMCDLPVWGTSGNLSDLQKVMNAPLSALNDPQLAVDKAPEEVKHCRCILNKAKNVVSNVNLRNKRAEQRKEKLQELVTTSFSKKFINDYASHLEDVRYYTVNALGVFSKNKSEQEAKAERMLCSKPEDFQTAIQARCTLPPEKLNSRMEKIFAMLGQRSEGLGYLRKLNRQIMVNSNENGSLKLERKEFDMTRNGMVKTDLNVRFADNIVASILKDNRAMKAIAQMKGSPEDAIIQHITEQIMKDDKFLTRFLDKSLLGESVYNDMVAQFKDPVKAMDVVKGKLTWAKQVHPGFELLMKRRDIFQQASEKIRRNSSSAIDTLETDDSILAPDLVARCMNLKENLAQFVCTDEKDLVSNVPANELRHIVKANGDESDLLFDDLAICQNGSALAQNGVFTELVTQPYERQSDIIERLSNKAKKDQVNLFTKVMLQKNAKGDARDYLMSAADEGFRNRRGIFVDSFGSMFDVSDSEKVSFRSSDEPSISSASPSIAANLSGKDERYNSSSDKTSAPINQLADVAPQMMNSFTPNYVAPTAAPQDAPAPKSGSSEKSDMRTELREFLSNKDNQDNVERLIKEADDKQLAEIAKLRAETERSKEQILALASENEKLKLQQMQTEMKALEEKRAKAVATNVVTEEDSDADPRSSGRGSRDIASVSGEATGASTSGVTAPRGANTSGSGSVGSEAGVGGTKSGGLSGLRGELAGLAGNDSSGSDAVVISGAGQARTGSIEIKSADLSNEILNFLESEPDVQTLIKMRNSGMIYKYKVVENGKEVTKEIAIDYKALNENVKKLIDQKIADSGRAGSEAQRLSAEIRNLRRAYTYNSLKVILGEQLKRRQ